MDRFTRDILKVDKPRNHKVKNSFGVYDAYKWIRKNKWLNIGTPVTEHDFYRIIRGINIKLADNLLEGYEVSLPHKMGKLEVRKYDADFKLVDGVIKTNLPIDWKRTLELWLEDEETYKERTLIKMEEKEIFRVFYNRIKAVYKNKSFYRFKCNRSLKLRLKDKIKEGNFDAFKF